MRGLAKYAKHVFHRLTEGMRELGDHRKVANRDGYMPLSIEVVDEIPGHGIVVSLAHYYEQEGDLMRDPEMTFFVAAHNGEVYPLSFRNDGLGIDREGARWEETTWRVWPREQADETRFANVWMKNLKEQQL